MTKSVLSWKEKKRHLNNAEPDPEGHERGGRQDTLVPCPLHFRPPDCTAPE